MLRNFIEHLNGSVGCGVIFEDLGGDCQMVDVRFRQLVPRSGAGQRYALSQIGVIQTSKLED